MNERIQELAYEAEDYADSIVDRGGEFHPAYTKKFAELIVEKCADFIEQDQGTGEVLSNRLKKHFGVEE